MAFNQDIADKVLEKLSEGLSLRKSCEAVGSVTPRTILDWTEAEPDFGTQYTRTRARAYEMLADEIVQIADDGANDTYETENGNAVNQDVIARSRLRVDTRKWMLSKMLPKVYGEKTETTHKGSIGVTVAASPTDEAL